MATTAPKVTIISSGMTGAPIITNTANTFCAALKQVINTKIPNPTISQMSIANQRVVCTLTGGCRVVPGTWLQIENAAVAEVNGWFQIEGLLENETKFYFTVPTAPDTAVVGGTITYSYQKPNWEVVAERTNELVVRSAVDSPSRLCFWFKDSSAATGAHLGVVMVRGLKYFNSFTDYDLDSIPSQVQTGLNVADHAFYKCQTNTTAACWWYMVFTDKTFYFIPSIIPVTTLYTSFLSSLFPPASTFMGELKSYIANDAGAGFIVAESANTPIANTTNNSTINNTPILFQFINSPSRNTMSRYRDSLGLAPTLLKKAILSYCDDGNYYSGDNRLSRGPYNKFTGELLLTQIQFSEVDSASIINQLSGVYLSCHNLAAIFKPFQLIKGTGPLNGRLLLQVGISASSYAFSNDNNNCSYFIDTTGPWE